MRTSVVLCLIALVAFAAAKPNHQPQKTDTHAALLEMENSKFGSAFLSFLSMNSASDIPIDEVTTILNELLDQLQNRQADADAQNNTNEALCDETLSNFRSQIATSEATIASLENAITTNSEILDQAKRDLNQAATDYDETVAALESGTAQRESEHTRWVDIDYEHTEGIVAIEETIKLIKHMIHGVTFAQIKPRYEKVQETLKKSTKFGTLFKPLILSLSELATKLNYENVIHILDLLNNILNALRQSQTDYRNTEEQAARDWEALEAHLSEQKQSLADKRARLNSLISATEEIIAQSEASLSFHTQTLVQVQASHDEQENWCITVSEVYVNETNERSRQTDILTRLSEHIADRWGAVAEYLQTRQNDF